METKVKVKSSPLLTKAVKSFLDKSVEDLFKNRIFETSYSPCKNYACTTSSILVYNKEDRRWVDLVYNYEEDEYIDQDYSRRDNSYSPLILRSAKTLCDVSENFISDFEKLSKYMLKSLLRFSKPQIRFSDNKYFNRYELVLPKLRKAIERSELYRFDKSNNTVGYLDDRKFGYLRTTEQIFYYNGSKLVYMSIGKGVRKCLKKLGVEIDDNQLKDLTNIIKSQSRGHILKVVEGEDIRTYYHYDKYNHSENIGSLANSCMRYDSCQNYLDMYVLNCKMLILLDETTDTILGRALIWDNATEIDGTPFKYLDRIYANEKYFSRFFDWAKDNGYAYKTWQDYSSTTQFTLPSGDEVIKYIKSEVVSPTAGWYRFPYLDTLLFLYGNSVYNSIPDYKSISGEYAKKLRSTCGSYENYNVRY